MTPQQIMDLIAHNGFALIFAAWALFRLDRFLQVLIDHEAREAELLRQIATSVDRSTRT